MASSRTIRGGAALLLLLLATGARPQLSDEQALAQVFPEARLREQGFELDEAQRERLAAQLGFGVRERYVRFHRAYQGERLVGSAIVMSELAKTLPMRFLVSIRPDGRVDQVLLLRFLEPRGWEVERPAFRSQYAGKSTSDPIRRGQDIRNVSGATISVDSMSRGVRRALALYELLLGEPERRLAESASTHPHGGN